MAFGHHGGNVPVKDVTTGRTLITAQNHLYHVEKESLNGTDLELTHYALNDGTVQGVKHKGFKAFSVQFLPEVHTGPADSQYLFDQFVNSFGGAR
jgi:carbamoyl-phosphate synthase small subunit